MPLSGMPSLFSNLISFLGAAGRAGAFCEHLEGDYFSVMGLPVCSLAVLLRRFGAAVLGECGEG